MAHLPKSAVSLRIMGDDLAPDEISKLIGTSPTLSQTKGQEIIGQQSGKVRIARHGMWLLRAADREPEDLDGQIDELLSQTTNSLEIWRGITEKYDVDLFCSLFLHTSNEGFTMSAKSLAALGERGIEVALDIYAGNVEKEATNL